MSHNLSIFKNRKDAGKKLGQFFQQMKIGDAVVLALPRGGVTVAHEVAHLLGVTLDVLIARKIGPPEDPEYGIGAMSEDEVPLFNPGILNSYDVKGPDISAVVNSEREELRRRISHYRGNRKLPPLQKKTVVLIDDGLATGVTAAAAGAYLRKLQPKKSILAIPVGPKKINPYVQDKFDEIICLHQPEIFSSVGLWYEDFTQVEDSQVMQILSLYHSK